MGQCRGLCYCACCFIGEALIEESLHCCFPAMTSWSESREKGLLLSWVFLRQMLEHLCSNTTKYTVSSEGSRSFSCKTCNVDWVEETFFSYLESFVQLGSIIQGRRGHQGHNQALKQPTELRFQRADQVLMWGTEINDQRNVNNNNCVCIELSFAWLKCC